MSRLVSADRCFRPIGALATAIVALAIVVLGMVDASAQEQPAPKDTIFARTPST
ncbi:MAG TPA: hypothetical protein VNY53_00980 [Bradyrhizobium sp.]|nr:hypothetical protein [Bradyrhizobium sp.]